MFASHIGGEMLLTTSTHQIILFKYAKVGQNIAINVYTTVLLSARNYSTNPIKDSIPIDNKE